VADTDLNKVIKMDYVPVKISYTSKDYASILDDLINSVSGITEKWQVLDDNDPGVIMIKLMSIIGDMLFYTQDMQALEVYPNSVTQRKNAATIYKLIGYKMRWYRSATLTMQLRELETDGVVSRKIYPEVPPKVEYKLTDLGKSFVPILTDMQKWSEDNLMK